MWHLKFISCYASCLLFLISCKWIKLAGNLCFRRAKREEVGDVICALFLSLLSDGPFGSLRDELWVGRRGD